MSTSLLKCLILASSVWGIDWDPESDSSVRDGTLEVVKGLLNYYPLSNPNSSDAHGWVPGMFQQPYYWWEAGVAWGMLVDWQFFTGETQYNDMVKTALTFQAGSSGNYMPANQSTTEGNDDQGFWGLTVMGAAERNFTNPGDDHHGWLYSAQAVFNSMKARWDTSECDGGLRWQIYTWNAGYDYKNTVSNGCLFNLAARLARYTGNETYADWAEKVFTWLLSEDLINHSGSNWLVYDGATMNSNCSDLTKIEWTYTYGLMLSGCAYMYDFQNQSSSWESRAKSLWGRASEAFFQNGVMYEAACQPNGRCNNDQRCFKGIFSQLLGHVATFLPSLRDDVMTQMNSSASAAAKSCSGGTDGHTCGLNWFKNGWDNQYGLGEQICALGVLSNTQVLGHDKPYTAKHGGTSNGSVNAGEGSQTLNPLEDNSPITTADRAGAGILTAVLMIFLIAVGVWILI